MQRVTLTIDDDLLAAIDAHGARHGYQSRSEAVRDMLRASLGNAAKPAAEAGTGHCHATLSYLYDHEKRELARRLTQVQHGHHDLAVASLHVHLDHDTCLEVAVLRGPTSDVKALADSVTTQRGVRYGHLHILPEGEANSLPGDNKKPANHLHAEPRKRAQGHEPAQPQPPRSHLRKAD